MIDVHYAGLTSQWSTARGILSRWSPIQIINPVQQGLTLVNRQEQVFPFGDSRTIIDYTYCLFLQGSCVQKEVCL